MSNTLRISLQTISKSLRREPLVIANSILWQSVRPLYAEATLGIPAFIEQRNNVKYQLANIENKFREKMVNYAAEDSKSMIFTEDLKNMIHLAENDEDIALVVKMMKKFNGQNKQLRFGSFVFGPVVMRLFYVHKKADLALECFKSPQLEGFFDQLMSYQILLDLLYENERYTDILELYPVIKGRQLDAIKYPRNVIVLVMAACYKINTKESLEFTLNLWNEIAQAGHFPMRRATTFAAGLALNQGKPEMALEILSAVRKPNYYTIRNIKVHALTNVGRLEDALGILKSIISEDQPEGVAQTFNKDVLDNFKAAVEKSGDPEMLLEYNKLEKIFEEQRNITDVTLDQQLCSEIQPPPMIRNKEANRFSRYAPGQTQRLSPVSRRPGLRDMV